MSKKLSLSLDCKIGVIFPTSLTASHALEQVSQIVTKAAQKHGYSLRGNDGPLLSLSVRHKSVELLTVDVVHFSYPFQDKKVPDGSDIPSETGHLRIIFGDSEWGTFISDIVDTGIQTFRQPNPFVQFGIGRRYQNRPRYATM